MMKREYNWLILIALCFLALASTGCKRAQLRAQLKEMIGATVVLPKKIDRIFNGEEQNACLWICPNEACNAIYEAVGDHKGKGYNVSGVCSVCGQVAP